MAGRVPRALHRMSHDVTGRINIYTCAECRRQVVTVDRDAGVAPFTVQCRAFGGMCAGTTHSALYPTGVHELVPTHEWYAPDVAERNRLVRMKEHAKLDHIMRGGLLLRAVGVGADGTSGR